MKFIKQVLIERAPKGLFVFLVNTNNKLKKRPGTVGVYDKDIFVIDDGSKKVYSPRRTRVSRYFFGVDKQCNSLAADYLIDRVEVSTGDVVIDCGANNGEIGIWAKNHGMNYYAFEPEMLESRCCDLNNFDGEEKTVRKGLWYENTTIHWHSKPETADSSIIEIDDTDEVTSIDTVTLDHFVEENKLDKIRIFKLEAEGAEPEVLAGAMKSLSKIDYIAVDCGYERGLQKTHTFMEIYKVLTDNDFHIEAAEFKRVVFLFKRKGAK